MKKKRYLYISTFDISLPNGPGVNEREFILELCKNKDYDIEFIIPRPVNNINELNEYDHKFHYIRSRNKKKLFDFLSIQFDVIKEFRIFIQSSSINLLIYRPVFMPFSQIYCHRVTKIPYVLKTLGRGVLNPFSNDKNLILNFFINLLNQMNKPLISKLIKNAKRIDVCTEEYKKYFTDRYGLRNNQIKVIENATNTDRFFPKEKDKIKKELNLDEFKQIIGYIGGSPAERGGYQMIEILPALVKKYPHIGAVIVGDKVESLIDLARKKNVLEKCRFPGKVNYELVPKYINSFDVGISMSPKNLVNKFGNSSQKIRQYLACGVPVVSVGVDNNSFLEEYNFGSSIKSVENLEDIKKACEKWLNINKGEMERFSLNARTYAEKNLSVKHSTALRLMFWENL